MPVLLGVAWTARRPRSDPRWAQVIDVEILRKATECLLPGLLCGCCGTVTFAGAAAGPACGRGVYGPVLNAAAVLLSCYGNVPAERSAQLIGDAARRGRVGGLG